MRRSYLFTIGFSVIALITVILLLSWNLWQARQAALNLSKVTLQYQARVLGEEIGLDLNELENQLNRLVENPDIWRTFSHKAKPSFIQSVRRNAIGALGAQEFRFINSRGDVINTTETHPIATLVADEQFFRMHRNQLIDFVIEAPIVSNTGGSWKLSISRPVVNVEGKMLGVIQLLAKLSEFQNLISRNELGGFEQAALFNSSETVLATWPPARQDSPSYVGMPLEKVDGFGSAIDDNFIQQNKLVSVDNQSYMAIYKVPNYPMYIGLTRTFKDVLMPWHVELKNTLWVIFCLVIGILVIDISIYRRMTKSEEMDKEVRRLFIAVEQSPASVIITDTEGQIQYVNPRFTSVTGYSPNEVLGKNPRILKTDHTKPETYETLWKTITDGGEWQGEFFNRKKNGEFFWEAATISPIHDSSGKITNFLAIKEDITERRRSNTELKLAKAEAEKANHAKSEFLAAMSHDLRTPLNAIMGFAEMMKLKTFGELGDEHYEQYVKDIYDSGGLLISLINDVLDLSKIEAGKFTLSEEILSVSSLVDSSFRQLEKMADVSDQTLWAEIDPKLPQLWGDERVMIQVLNNLLSNAIKFTPSGGNITVAAGLNDNNGIVIKVIDTGIGMSEEGIEKALQPFEQAHGTHSRRNEGTGLGLHLCVNFMKLFSGRLEIESEVAKGTTVILTFPPKRTLIKK